MYEKLVFQLWCKIKVTPTGRCSLQKIKYEENHIVWQTKLFSTAHLPFTNCHSLAFQSTSDHIHDLAHFNQIWHCTFICIFRKRWISADRRIILVLYFNLNVSNSILVHHQSCNRSITL